MASEGKEEPSEERRGSGTPDFSDQEQDFAQKALQQFEAANYDACLSSLSKLEELRPKDTKVLHNKAVAEFYKSGCERTDDLLKALNGLKKKMNHKNSSDQEANSEALDVEKAVLLYNRAVYCFYVKKYVDSLRNLERLSKIVESLDKNLAQNVCFLLAEVYLITYQTEKATAVLNSLEKLLYDPAKQASENGNEDGIKKPETDIPQPDDEQKLRLHKYKARVHLLQKSIKACKKEIKTIMNVNNMDTEGLFIKSNFEYVRHNERKAVKILNSASKDNQVLKTGESISAMYFNNLGCLHFQMQKYNLASFYFCRAIAENEKALALISADKSNPLNGRPLCTLSLNCRYHLLYNLGVQMLHDGRPLLAFDCLIESVQVYQSNPRLWLRLAECCIMAYHMSIIEEKTVDDSRKSNLVHSVVGSGLFRKVVLETPKEHCNKNTASSGSHSAAMPACNLHFGLLCLRNGLVLIPENWTASVDEKEGSEVDTSHPDETASHSTSIPAAPSPPVKGQEIQKLRNFILTGISYVSLILGDYVQSLEHAQSLLSQPQLCGSLSFLGHMYAAEAMIHLGRIPEAISHLSPDHISNFSNHGSNDHVPGSTISQFPQNMTEGKTMFLVNLAVAHCLREEFDKAKKCLYQATSMIPLKDLPNEAIALAIYIELQLGNPRGALQIIKRHQLLLPGKVNDKQRRLRKSFI